MRNVFYGLQDFLKEVAPYVVVCGSFSRHQENDESDIDCFLRIRPDYDPEEDTDESYMPKILDIIGHHDLLCSSVVIGHIAVEQQFGFERMVEISTHYKLPKANTPFYKEICGVKMLCCQDDKSADYDDCYFGDDIVPYDAEAK